jgi:hypothetical protein
MQALLGGWRNPRPSVPAMSLRARCMGCNMPASRTQHRRTIYAQLVAGVVAECGRAPLEGRQQEGQLVYHVDAEVPLAGAQCTCL